MKITKPFNSAQTLLMLLLYLFSVNSNTVKSQVFTKLISYNVPDTQEIAIKITVPANARYGTNAPVAIFVQGGLVPDGVTPLLPASIDSFGFIAIQFNFPGGTGSGGIYDYRGPHCLDALKDIVLFATNQKKDKDNNYLSDLTGAITPLSSNVGLIGISMGGNAATTVTGIIGNQFPGLAWILNWESPVGDVIPTAEAGTVNTGNNPLNNPAYNDTTGIFDYSYLEWDDTVSIANGVNGGFYFDMNNNNIVDWGTDFVIQPFYIPTDWGPKTVTSIALIKNAYYYGKYPSAPPAHLTDSIQIMEFWKWRNGVYWIDSIPDKIPNLMFMVLSTEIDHVQSALDYPHVLLQYEKFRTAGVRFSRINPDKSYLEYVMGTAVPTAVDNSAGTAYNHLTIRNTVEPENISPILDAYLYAAGACELADRTECNDTTSQLNNILTCYTSINGTTEHVNVPIVYPNPAGNNISIEGINDIENTTICIYDILGKQVMNIAGKSKLQNIDISELPAGVYNVTVSDGTKIQTKKFVKTDR